MPRKGNYKTKWTPELLDEYLRRIAIDGLSARQVGKMDDMPSYEALYNLMQKDENVRQRYYLAMESKATALDDRIDEYIQLVADGALDYNAGKLAVETNKWRMAKYYPRFYGEVQKHEVEVKDSYVDELRRVAQRVQEQRLINAEVIEGEVVGSDEGKEPLKPYTRAPEAEIDNHSQGHK